MNDHSAWAILHCAVIIYWKVGSCKQQLSRETNQLKKIMSYSFPDSDPGKIINYKINVIHGTWDLILSMLGFERFWLCWKCECCRSHPPVFIKDDFISWNNPNSHMPACCPPLSTMAAGFQCSPWTPLLACCEICADIVILHQVEPVQGLDTGSLSV